LSYNGSLGFTGFGLFNDVYYKYVRIVMMLCSIPVKLNNLESYSYLILIVSLFGFIPVEYFGVKKRW